MNRVLVRLPNWVGDVIMATPLLRALHDYLPDTHIDVAGRASLRPLVDGLPYFIEYLEAGHGVGAGRRLAGELRSRGYDCALVLPHSVGARWPIALSGIPRRVGYRRYFGRNFLLTERLPVPRDRAGRFVPTPMHEYYLGFLRVLGGPAHVDPWPELPVTDAAATEALALRTEHGIADTPYIVVNPGASFGASKLWTVDGFAWVADALARETGARIVLVGGPGEEATGRAIAEQMREPAVDCFTRPVGLAALYALIAESALLVTVDSGPRHMATAARTPVVVVMGPTDPRYTNACLDQTAVVRTADLYCLGCHEKVCPTEHECMTLLPPQRVLDAALDLWRAHGPATASATASAPQ